MGDGAEKSVVAFVAADFTNEKDGVEGDADDEEREERDAQSHGNDATPVEQNPADVEGYGHANEAHAEQCEEHHVPSSSAEAHGMQCKAPATEQPRGRLYSRSCAGS